MKKIRMLIKLFVRCTVSLLLCGLLLSSELFVLPARAQKAPPGGIIVSLGDSYSSGEGVEKFYRQDLPGKTENQDWLAHRSERSWPGQLTLPSVDGPMASKRDSNWFFAASSGAETKHLDSPQAKTVIRGIIKKSRHVDPQLQIFDKLQGRKADYVTITIGGNDAGFANIVKSSVSCVPYLDFDGLEKKIDDALLGISEYTEEGNTKGGDIYRSMKDAFAKISQMAGPQAAIIVVGYPKLFSEKGSVVITKTIAEMVNSATSLFNMRIERVVNQCKQDNINIHFVSVEKAFENHGAYSEEPFIRPISLLAQEDLDYSKAISAYSMHPNCHPKTMTAEECNGRCGICAYAKCVQTKIDELESEKEKRPQVLFCGTCGKEDNKPLIWTLDDEGTLTISGNGKMKDYSFAWDYDFGIIGLDISQEEWDKKFESAMKVRSPWFYDEYCATKNGEFFPTIKKLIVEEGITSIGTGAFFGANSLEEVSLPTSLREMQEQCLACCQSLHELVLPEGVEELTGACITISSGIETLTLPRSLKKMDAIPDALNIIFEGSWSQWVVLTGAAPPENVTVAIDDKPTPAPSPTPLPASAIPEMWRDFITRRAYYEYLENWNPGANPGWGSEPDSFAIIDLNADGLDELILATDGNAENYGFGRFMIFEYDRGSNAITQVQIVESSMFPDGIPYDRYIAQFHGSISYSADLEAFSYTSFSYSYLYQDISFFTIKNHEVQSVFSLYHDTTGNKEVFQFIQNGTKREISQQEFEQYLQSRQGITFNKLSELR